MSQNTSGFLGRTSVRARLGYAAQKVKQCRAFALAPSHISLPRYPCRVDLHVGFFKACSAFTHVAAFTRARSPSRDPYPEASAISSPPCLLRLLPAGADAGWDLHPLESAALHGAQDTQPPIPTFADSGHLRCNGSFVSRGGRVRTSVWWNQNL